MITTIKRFFEENITPNSQDLKEEERAIQLALASLMIEVAEADFEDTPEEREAILTVVENSFDLGTHDAADIIKLARNAHRESTDYFQFTHLVNEHYTAEQKIKLIENLWQIAFADKQLDKYEEHVIRRIADLIYVSHSDFMRTKLHVQQEMISA